MKNVAFWDINPSSYITADILHLRYRACYVRFEVFTAVSMKNAAFGMLRLVALSESTFRRNVAPPNHVENNR
jgi:hypothetical protein